MCTSIYPANTTAIRACCLSCLHHKVIDGTALRPIGQSIKHFDNPDHSAMNLLWYLQYFYQSVPFFPSPGGIDKGLVPKKKKKKKVRRYVISTPGLFAPVQRPPRPQLTGDGPDGFRRSHIRHLPDIVDTWLLGTWRIPGSLEICALFFLLVSEIFSVKSVSKHCRRCWHGFEPFIVSAKKWQRHYYQTTSMYIIQTWYDRRDRSTSWDKIRLPSNSSSRFESAPLVVSTHWHLAFVCRKKFLCAGQILHIVASAKQTSGIRQCLLAAE